jgi:hypothetical protein
MTQKLLSLVAAGMLFLLPSVAQQKKEPPPRVWSAQAPLYPPVAVQASVQGLVTLRVTTDGKQVVNFDAESGPPYLVIKTNENVKTWKFQPHTPTSFEIKFEYTLSAASPPCAWDSADERAKEFVVLRLPTYVELHAIIPVDCDPAVPVDVKK